MIVDQNAAVSWHRAWADAATGPRGFWRSERVGDHFRTASNSPLLAQLIVRLLRLRPQIGSVIEIGAGDGRLLRSLRQIAPEVRLTGIDVRPPPPDLGGVDWLTARWDTFDDTWHPDPGLAVLDEPTMIICSEWLDDLPCPIAVQDGDRWREVLVDPDGSEQLGAPVAEPCADWLRRWWHGSARAEVGLTRDRAWTGLISALRTAGGTALMIDYGHLRDGRPPEGSLTAYASGRQLPARPDPRLNLTADVAVDATAAAGADAGAHTAIMITQREAVDRFLPRPSADESQWTDPLRELQDRGERHALASIFGHHWWLLQDVPAA